MRVGALDAPKTATEAGARSADNECGAVMAGHFIVADGTAHPLAKPPPVQPRPMQPYSAGFGGSGQRAAGTRTKFDGMNGIFRPFESRPYFPTWTEPANVAGWYSLFGMPARKLLTLGTDRGSS